MKKILLFVVAAFMFACTPAPTYTILGEVEGGKSEGKEVYLKSISSDKALDTVVVKDGKFVFTGELQNADMVNVTVNGIRSSPKLIIEPNATTTILVKANGGATIAGTPTNDALQKLNAAYSKIYGEFMTKYADLKVKYKDDQEKLKAEITRVNNEEFSVPLEKLFKETFESNKTNILGTDLFINSFLGNFKSLDKINAFIVEVPTAANYAPIKKVIEGLIKEQNTSAGKMFTDFPARNIEDTADIKLSDYVGKGKYVLVDFWASWCSPCRAEMPQLAKLHKKYAKKGLVILSANVWDKHPLALQSIKDMKMVWEQIYVPAENKSTDLYGIKGIPTIMLFAPDGTILYRSHGGHEMIEFVENIMDKK